MAPISQGWPISSTTNLITESTAVMKAIFA
jgi:hypothetical protein